jgi:hypothetical protein
MKVLLLLLIFPLLSIAKPQEECANRAEKIFKLPQSIINVEKGDLNRLTAMMRSQGTNILSSEVQIDANIPTKWNRLFDLFFSEYSAKNGKKVRLVYSRNGNLLAYKLISNEQVFYRCIAEDSIISILNSQKQKSE